MGDVKPLNPFEMLGSAREGSGLFGRRGKRKREEAERQRKEHESALIADAVNSARAKWESESSARLDAAVAKAREEGRVEGIAMAKNGERRD